MDENQLYTMLTSLNSEQQDAIDHITSGWWDPTGSVRLTIVDGPPGTGKTAYVVAPAAGEWIHNQGHQVVILTPTHQAARRAWSALIDVGFQPQEVFHLAPGPVAQPAPGCITFDRAEDLRAHHPHLARQLNQSRVLITAWHGSQRALSFASNFLLLFDEVSQVPFSAFMSLMTPLRRRGGLSGYALIGDRHQLPVVTTQDVLSTNAALGILARHPECTPHSLASQYRMNTPICELVNEVRRVAFGGAPLQPANNTIAQATLDQLTGYYYRGTQFDDVLDPDFPVVFVNTSRFTGREIAEGGSWAYGPEARLAIRLAEAVEQAFRISPMILSPYRAQESLIRRYGVSNVRTIYKAQGHEWECVILTLGRTTVWGRTILNEVYQHTYVGLSRARGKLIVLLNTNLFHQFPLFNALLNAINIIPGARLIEADPSWGEL